MADDLGTDPEELLPQARQRPVLHRFRQGQPPHEVAEIVGQRMKLRPDGVSDKRAARQSRPFHGVLAFLDALLGRAALIVETDDTFGRARQVGDDEADTGIKLARMPFDFGHDTARHGPALRSRSWHGTAGPRPEVNRQGA